MNAQGFFQALTKGTKLRPSKKSSLNSSNTSSTAVSASKRLFASGLVSGTSTMSSSSTDAAAAVSAGNSSGHADAESIRRATGISVQGDNVPSPITAFSGISSDSSINTWLASNTESSMKWKEPSAVQMQALPIMMARRDAVVVAPTGSGKTAAYLLPLLGSLQNRRRDGVRALILAPTKELAQQIKTEMVLLSRGRSFKVLLLTKATAATLKQQLLAGAVPSQDVIVATPHRLSSLASVAKQAFAKVEFLVLDEVDRLLNAADGFLEQIDEIVSACAPGCVKCLFSATLPPAAERLAESICDRRVKVIVGKQGGACENVTQNLTYVGNEEGKLLAVRNLCKAGLKPPALIFLQSKERAHELFKELVYESVPVDVIHAGRTPQQREKVIEEFRKGKIWVLVCTDVIARGIDFKGVNMVINYDFPQTPVQYIHRIGRTGRAGRSGVAFTYFGDQDMNMLRPIANIVKLSGGEVPDWMLQMKQLSRSRRKDLAAKPLQRDNISTAPNQQANAGKRQRKAGIGHQHSKKAKQT